MNSLFFLAGEGTQKKFLESKVLKLSTHPLQFILVYFGPFLLEENMRPLKVNFAKKKLIFKTEFRNFFRVFPSDEY